MDDLCHSYLLLLLYDSSQRRNIKEWVCWVPIKLYLQKQTAVRILPTLLVQMWETNKTLQGHSFSKRCFKEIGRSTCWKNQALTSQFCLNGSDYHFTFLEPFKLFKAYPPQESFIPGSTQVPSADYMPDPRSPEMNATYSISLRSSLVILHLFLK